MTDSPGALRRDYDRITIPTIWVAFALSILLHALGLIGWFPRLHIPFEEPKLGQPSGTLAIRLVPFTAPPVQAPPPAPEAAAPVRPKAAPAEPAKRSRPAPARLGRIPDIRQNATPAPPVIASEAPSPSPATVAPPAEAPRPAATDDLASFIASRRRAREGNAAPAPAPAPAAPTETEQEKHNRIVAENLGLTSVPSFGNDPNRGGGVFQIRSMGFDIAEFAFFGWNKDINRNSLQVIEVRRGNNPNMEIAVTRRIIGIIRERTPDNFLWQSRRLGRGVWLSARPADNAGLEEFIRSELFPQLAPAQAR